MGDFKGASKILIKHVFYVLAGIMAFFALRALGIRCLFRLFTGVPCPSCGMSRAFLSLTRLDFCNSFYYHPLLVPALIAVFIAIHMDVPNFRLNKKVCTVYVWGFIAVFFAVYLFRLMTNGIP